MSITPQVSPPAGTPTPTDPITEAAKAAAQVMGFRSESGRELIRDIVAAAAPVLREPPGIYSEVKAERQRAHDKHGETSMESQLADDPFGQRRDIIAEEVGEIAREYNDARHENRPVDLARVRAELIQLAAMAAAWADAITVSAPVRGVSDGCSA